MNKLVKIREKIKKAERLNSAKLMATKNGEVTPYKRSVYEERVNQAQEHISYENS